MTTHHSRGPRRSRPCTSLPPIVGSRADPRTSSPVPSPGRTGVYDAAVDGVAGDPTLGKSIPVPIPTPTHWVRVTCPACGVVRVRADQVVVRNCVDDESWSYRARCSGCDITFVGFTPASLALPAVAAGLVIETWTLPVPSPRHSGSPLHAVDALELHLAMLENDWFDQLARVEPLGDR